MNVNFKFANLIGSAYRNGNVLFSPDGNSVISPIGNKISSFDLKNNISRTIRLESNYNITTVAINGHGTHMLVANEAGEILYVNMVSETVIHRYRAYRPVKALCFSLDSKFCAIARGGDLQLHEILPVTSSAFSPFLLKNTFKLSSENVTCVDWSKDGNLIVAGSDDKVTRIVGSRPFRNLFICAIGSHKADIVTVGFFKDSYDLVSVDRRGLANAWKCNQTSEDLVDGYWTKDDEEVQHLQYVKDNKCMLCDASGGGRAVDVTAARFNASCSLLVSCFDNGVFVLHEVPSFALIHSLRISDVRIATCEISPDHDWLALGCGKGSEGQLVVWEWPSETYLMKQQSHSLRILSARYSPDGSHLATAAEDGKVKVWNCRSGFCIVTFDEHTSAATALAWTQSGKAILSASLDGTVRARDLKRYRNFRTLVCPEPTQLGSLVVDPSGDMVIAGAKEVFEIFVWSMENGQLLDVLSGHSSVIAGLSLMDNSLASVSWDKTLKLWQITDSSFETVDLPSEGLAVSFSPSAQMLAVLTTDSVVTLFHSKNCSHIGTIETKFDVDAARLTHDVIKKDTSGKAKSLTCLSFSPDGSLLLVGGQSNFVCLYSVEDRLLMKKFTLTLNRSLDGVVLDISRRNLSEFGNLLLVDSSDSEDEGGKRAIRLAGTRHSDKAERSARPVMEVLDVSFCPTGRRFSVCSSEGVSVYSLDHTFFFDPFQLERKTSVSAVRKWLDAADYTSALKGSLQLSDNALVEEVVEHTPLLHMPLVVSSLSPLYVVRLLKWFTTVHSSRVHLYMVWLRNILTEHGGLLKARGETAILTAVIQLVQQHSTLISSMANRNKYSLKYLIEARKLERNVKSSAMEVA